MSPRHSVWPDQQTRPDTEYCTCSQLTRFQGNKFLLEPWVKHYCDILTFCKKEYDTGQIICIYLAQIDRQTEIHRGMLKFNVHSNGDETSDSEEVSWVRMVYVPLNSMHVGHFEDERYARIRGKKWRTADYNILPVISQVSWLKKPAKLLKKLTPLWRGDAFRKEQFVVFIGAVWWSFGCQNKTAQQQNRW